MLNIINVLSATLSDTMGVIRIVCVAILAVCALALIILVMFQPAASEGMGALSGQSYDSFYSKNKVRTPEGIMKRLTIVLSVLVVIVTILFFITGIWIEIK